MSESEWLACEEVGQIFYLLGDGVNERLPAP
jgi:hypothetical protein